MTQRRSWNYLADDKTDDMNHSLLGILRDGVYAGFDIDITVVSGTDLTLYHETGYEERDINLDPIAKSGCFVTKQGVIIKDEDPLVLPINPNATGNWRIDTVIYEHEYLATAGGAAAVPSVVQGTAAANPVPAALPNPEKNTVIGYLHIPPGWTDFAGNHQWVKNHIPTHETLTLKEWQTATYSGNVTKNIDIRDKTGNLFSMTFGTSTFELQTIKGLDVVSKLVILWFKDEGRIVTGGNINISSTYYVGADSFATLISYKTATGIIQYHLLGIQAGNVAYLNRHNKYTRMNSNAQAQLDVSLSTYYNTGAEQILTGALGNLLQVVNMDAGQVFGDFRVSSLEAHQDGTELIVAFYAQDPGDEGTLDLTANMWKPEGYTDNAYTIKDGEIIHFWREDGKWRWNPITDVLRRVKLLEKPTMMTASLSMGDMDTEPSVVGALNKKVEMYKVHDRCFIAGKKISTDLTVIGPISIPQGSILWVQPNGYKPTGGGDYYVNVPKLTRSSLPSPPEFVTLKFDNGGDVELAVGSLVTDDVLDCRGINFPCG